MIARSPNSSAVRGVPKGPMFSGAGRSGTPLLRFVPTSNSMLGNLDLESSSSSSSSLLSLMDCAVVMETQASKATRIASLLSHEGCPTFQNGMNCSRVDNRWYRNEITSGGKIVRCGRSRKL